MLIRLYKDDYWYHDEEILRVQDVETVFSRHLLTHNAHLTLDQNPKDSSWTLRIFLNNMQENIPVLNNDDSICTIEELNQDQLIYSTTFSQNEYISDQEIKLFQDIILEIIKVTGEELNFHFYVKFFGLNGWMETSSHGNQVAGEDQSPKADLLAAYKALTLASKVAKTLW